MKRSSAALFSAIFLVFAPGIVIGLIPWLMTGWNPRPVSWDPVPLRILGIALIALGLIALLDSMVRFALQGHGTPAPLLPPDILVIVGPYRFVRNPMYVALLALLGGQALFLGSTSLLLYAACAWLTTHAFVCFYEEPTLRRVFGSQYELYCAHVRRWFPRLTPWIAGR